MLPANYAGKGDKNKQPIERGMKIKKVYNHGLYQGLVAFIINLTTAFGGVINSVGGWMALDNSKMVASAGSQAAAANKFAWWGPSMTTIGGDRSGRYLVKTQITKNIIEKHKTMRP